MGVLMEAGVEYALVPRFTCGTGLYFYCSTGFVVCPSFPVSGPGADYISVVYYGTLEGREPFLQQGGDGDFVYKVVLLASPRWVVEAGRASLLCRGGAPGARH
jgi:hypothetical protein